MSDEDANLDLGSMFTEPPRPPTPEATISVYNREERNVKTEFDWRSVEIKLVGNHPLWGHHLWNAAIALATYLDDNTPLYDGRNVLELGAGGALPSIVAAKNGASKVVITDYPDTDLIRNIEHNVQINISDETRPRVDVEGYIWGQPTGSLLEKLDASTKFDLIILSDLIFNHSQHEALLKTCERLLTSPVVGSDVPDLCVLVFYTHHRPHLAHRDMEFFQQARNRGWSCDEFFTKKFPPMFPDDSGDEIVRSTVHGWKLTR